MKKYLLFLILSMVFISACGDPEVDITGASYEPKIVVEGYLYPGEPVRDIRIMRNFKLNSVIDTSMLFIDNAIVSINGQPLQYNGLTRSYFSNSLSIEHGKKYELQVTASIDGEQLTASSSTVVPLQGFNVLTKNLGIHRYGVDTVLIKFNPSPSSDFYALSIIPDSASLNNFIYDNKFQPNVKIDNLIEFFNRFRFQSAYLLNITANPVDTVSYIIKEFDTWFYSSYRTIIYAGDKNFRDYVITAKRVREFDGNFHEPVLNFTGDGIGVFASAIKDTIYFSIVP
jgi:hypothetical protein